jgi:hypothetical protein
VNDVYIGLHGNPSVHSEFTEEDRNAATIPLYVYIPFLLIDYLFYTKLVTKRCKAVSIEYVVYIIIIIIATKRKLDAFIEMSDHGQPSLKSHRSKVIDCSQV